jgi:gliding motility-associated-like protein
MLRVYLFAIACIFVQPIFGQFLLGDPLPDISESNFMCTLTADTTGTSPAICNGTSTGSAYFKVQNAAQPVLMYLDGLPTPYSGTGIANSIAVGTHYVILVDALGCKDTVNFRITEPSLISVSATTTPAICAGQPNGRGNATASGGTTPYGYQWEPCVGGVITSTQSPTTLLAGCYNVTVTDKQGCSASTQTNVGQPPAIKFTSTVDSVKCFQARDGKASVSVTGGSPGYTYLWDNGASTPATTQLDARFHYVTITDAANCKLVAEVNVPGPERVIIDSVAQANPTCFGGSNGSASIFVIGGRGGYNYTWSAGTTSGNSATGLSSGGFRVTVVDGYGCRDSIGFVISAPPMMSSAVQNLVQETCAGLCNGAATINVVGGTTPYSYNWGVPGIPATSKSNTSLCARTYTVTITDANLCTTTRGFTINPGNAIAIQFNANAPSCAAGTNGTIQSQAFGGQSPITYAWSSGQSIPNLASLPCGTYTLTATDSKNCKDTATYTFTCPAALKIDSISLTQVLCFGKATGIAQVNATGGTTPLAYKWSDTGAQTSAKATALKVGTYTVTTTDSKGCTLVGNATITSPSLIVGTTTDIDVLCSGAATGSASITASGGVGAYTYAWSNGLTTNQITNLKAGTYSVVITDQNNCTQTANPAQITEPQPLSTIIDVLSVPCYNANTGALKATSTGGTGSVNYVWSQGSNSVGIDKLPTATYSVTSTDANACTTTATQVLVQHDSIMAQASATDASCAGTNDAKASITSVSGGVGAGVISSYQYQWNGLAQNGAIQNNIPAATYTVTITDQAKCSATIILAVKSPAAITPYLTPQTLKCFGDKDGILVLDSVRSALPITAYKWSTGSSDPAQITGLAIGTYQLSVTDATGCIGVASATVAQPDQIKIDSITRVMPLCTGGTDGALTVVTKGGTAPYSYNWLNQSAQTALLSQLPAGQYNVTVTDTNGCSTQDNATLTVPSPLVITSSAKDLSCFGVAIGQITLDIKGGKKPYRYSVNGDTTSYRSPTFSNLAAGTYGISVVDANGCNFSEAVEVKQPDKLSVDLGQDERVLYGNTVELTSLLNNASGNTTYKWSTSTTTDTINCIDTDCQSIMARPLFDATYQLRVQDAKGCVGIGSVRVSVDKPRGVFVPTGFTPNGDGENEVLMVFAKNHMIDKINVLRVFDRFGALVYELNSFLPNDQNIGWDGNFRGKPCDEGVFTYFLEAQYMDGYREQAQGNVTLIR